MMMMTMSRELRSRISREDGGRGGAQHTQSSGIDTHIFTVSCMLTTTDMNNKKQHEKTKKQTGGKAYDHFFLDQ